MSLKDRFLQSVTEKDGVTFCPVRITALAAVAGYHSLVAYLVSVQHTPLTMADCGLYAQHMATLGSALGVAIGAKSVLKGDAPSN
jgi:hypothetical protein